MWTRRIQNEWGWHGFDDGIASDSCSASERVFDRRLKSVSSLHVNGAWEPLIRGIPRRSPSGGDRFRELPLLQSLLERRLEFTLNANLVFPRTCLSKVCRQSNFDELLKIRRWGRWVIPHACCERCA